MDEHSEFEASEALGDKMSTERRGISHHTVYTACPLGGEKVLFLSASTLLEEYL